MKKTIKLTESDLTRIVRKVISEQSTDIENLYFSINSLIDREYSDMDPGDIQNVLHNIFNSYKAINYRKRKGIDSVSREDAVKRFR
jgi:nitrogen fixation/metabolism regulation signal transduction histidine kinase